MGVGFVRDPKQTQCVIVTQRRRFQRGSVVSRNLEVKVREELGVLSSEKLNGMNVSLDLHVECHCRLGTEEFRWGGENGGKFGNEAKLLNIVLAGGIPEFIKHASWSDRLMPGMQA